MCRGKVRTLQPEIQIRRRMRHLLLIGVIALSSATYAQTMTLKQCIETGLERNLGVRTVAEDVKTADVTRSENRSKLLPVIQAFGNFVDNVHRGTSVTDGSGISKLLGMDVPYMKNQGLQYTVQGGFQAQMPLYDHTIYIGMKIADRMKELSLVSLDKAREDLTMQIAQLYYLAQTTREQIVLTEKNIRSLESLDSITHALRDNGVVLAVDVKRVNINLANLRVARDNALAVYEQQLNLIRFTLDLAPEAPLELEPLKTREGRLEHVHYNGVSPMRYELQQIALQRQITEQQRKQIKAGYLPTLSLVGNLSWANFTDRFHHYFHDHESNHWYNTTSWGLQLNVPIFDRFIKRNAIRKANIGLDKLALAREMTEKQLQTQYLNGLNDWQNNRRTVETQMENYKLAEEVYSVAANQYREGVTSMSALLQDEMSMTQSQTAFVNAVYKYLVSELTLLKLTGQLDELTK